MKPVGVTLKDFVKYSILCTLSLFRDKKMKDEREIPIGARQIPR